MEIKPNPNTRRSAQPTSFVLFKSVQERMEFGSNCPTFTKENWLSIAMRTRSMLYLIGVRPRSLQPDDYPKRVELSYHLVGAVAANLAVNAAPSPEVRSEENRMYETIVDHLDLRRDLANRAAEREWAQLQERQTAAT